MENKKQSIHIVLADTEPFDGQLITVVDQGVVSELNELAKEREKLFKNANKLRDKNAQAMRKANKLMWRFIKSHGIQYNEETEAVGVSTSDWIYVGPKERIAKDPTAEPRETDKVKAKITKAERRKYNELLDEYQFINDRIFEQNLAVEANELKLIDFELNLLNGRTYDIEKQIVIIHTTTGKTFLCDR